MAEHLHTYRSGFRCEITRMLEEEGFPRSAFYFTLSFIWSSSLSRVRCTIETRHVFIIARCMHYAWFLRLASLSVLLGAQWFKLETADLRKSLREWRNDLRKFSDAAGGIRQEIWNTAQRCRDMRSKDRPQQHDRHVACGNNNSAGIEGFILQREETTTRLKLIKVDCT